MPRRSAGLLLYRMKNGYLEVFLVHPGGPFWEKRDLGSWSIPKGEFDDTEHPLEAAKRELREETGFSVSGKFIELAPIKQKGGKWVYSWAVEADVDPSEVKSNTFTVEFPPKTGTIKEFPEVDRADWFTIELAQQKILPSQMPLIFDLVHKLGKLGKLR